MNFRTVSQNNNCFVHKGAVDSGSSSNNGQIANVTVGKHLVLGTRAQATSKRDIDETRLVVKDEFGLLKHAASHEKEGKGKHKHVGKPRQGIFNHH